MPKKNDWLLECSRNVTSQRGEDGILEKIFKILDVQKGWCVEFGAWDGKLYSNTYNLIQNHGWSAVLIEGEKSRFADLLKTYGAHEKVSCLERFVDFDPPHDLDSLLAETPIPHDVDLISIDIDGCDYHIWKSITVYQPKVVLIEFNPTIPNHSVFVQPRDSRVSQGNSLLAYIELGKQLGYELVAATACNGIFVKKAFFPLFEIEDNSIDQMRKRSACEFTCFQLFDGTLVFDGPTHLNWGGERLR